MSTSNCRLCIWGGVLVSALLGTYVNPSVSHSLKELAFSAASQPGIVFWNALSCLLIGIIEETIFCGGILPFLARKMKCAHDKPNTKPRSNSQVKATLICAAIFGIVHIFTGIQLEYGWIGVLLKCLQAGLFGLCMATLFLVSGHLTQPMLAHAAFDFIYLGIPNIAAGISPLGVETLPTESLVSVCISGLFLLALALYCIRVLTCNKNFHS